MRAIEKRDRVRARKILASGVNLSRPDHTGMTPLNQAIEYQLPDLALEMIRRGADVNIRPGVLFTPLGAAAQLCYADVVLSLLEHGAKVNGQNPDGETALISAASTCKDGKMIEILLRAGADPNISTGPDSRCTPLFEAAASGNERAVELLIAAGAYLNAENSLGETALAIARDHPFQTEAHKRIYVMLLKAGARE